MKKAPNLYTLQTLQNALTKGAFVRVRQGEWHPARPVGLFSFSHRIRLAWEVFTGRADAFRWPNGQ